MSWAIDFCTDSLGERQEDASCCVFPSGEGADSGICQAPL